MIEQQVQFHPALAPPELSPVVHRRAEVNHTAIQTEQLILKAKLLAPTYLLLALFQQLLEHCLVQLPRPVRVGVGQRRTLRALLHPQVPQLALAGRQTAANLPQRLRFTQLTEQHRYHLAPTAKTSRVTLSLVLLHRQFKLAAGKYLQKLRKNTAYSVQGGSPPGKK